MDWYKIAKDYYGKGIYSVEQVNVFFEKGKITKEQYDDITGGEEG